MVAWWGFLVVGVVAAGNPRESHRASEVVAAKSQVMTTRLAKRPLAIKGLGAGEVAVHVLATAAHRKFKTGKGYCAAAASGIRSTRATPRDIPTRACVRRARAQTTTSRSGSTRARRPGARTCRS